MKLTREQVEAMLADYDPRRKDYRPEMGKADEVEAYNVYAWNDDGSFEYLIWGAKTAAVCEAYLAAPDLARELLAAWDREAKLREAFARVDDMINDEGQFTERAWADLRALIGDTP